MSKITKTANDKAVRKSVFDMLMDNPFKPLFKKINDRQYGILMVDLNGTVRYARVGVIVAEERDDMTAEELMQAEIDAYTQKQADKAEKAKVKEKKITKDKARREAEAKAKAEQVSEG